jgi:hypothetical protein
VPLRRVLADTNVCYPISLLDLILRMDETGFHLFLWTEDLLAELVRAWVANGARSTASAERVCQAIRTTFPDQEVPHSEYEHLISDMPGADVDDHAHSAAAVARAPCTLVTANTRDFPAPPLALRGVRVTTPDDYLAEHFEATPAAVVDVIAEMAAARRQPAMTTREVLDPSNAAACPSLRRALAPTCRFETVDVFLRWTDPEDQARMARTSVIVRPAARPRRSYLVTGRPARSSTIEVNAGSAASTARIWAA